MLSIEAAMAHRKDSWWFSFHFLNQGGGFLGKFLSIKVATALLGDT